MTKLQQERPYPLVGCGCLGCDLKTLFSKIALKEAAILYSINKE
jgi:hypothetical protein